MPHVLFACTQLHSHGGIQRFNRNLVQAWVELGADVDIVSVNDTHSLSETYVGIKCVRCFYAGRNKRKWLLDMARLVIRGHYDVYVCGHINLVAAFIFIIFVFRRSFARSIMILHGIEAWGLVTGLKRLAASRISCVLGVSRYTVRNFLDQVGTFPAERTAVFPNTINPELAQRAPDLGHREGVTGKLKLLSVTRLDVTERDKGIIDVIAALKMIKDHVDFEYVIVGDGNDRKFLENLAESAGIIDRVRFSGALSDDALWRAYEEADVFVLPSSKEGFGIVFLEAMYFGLPVIGAAEKGALDVIRHGINGYLIEYGSIAQLEKCIVDLACHPEIRASMAKEGRAMVTENGPFSFVAFRERARRYFL